MCKSGFMKILVTGFKPFAGEKLNPSELLLPLLANQVGAVKLLPVEYKGAFDVLKQTLLAEPFDGAILIGQASGRKAISLEKVALNLEDAEIADEAGTTRTGTPILNGKSDAIINNLPIQKWTKILKDRGLPVETSLTAGSFVCNATYYRALHEIRTTNKFPPWALFVHVPYLPEQAQNKTPGTPALSLEKMAEVMRELITLIKSEKNLKS